MKVILDESKPEVNSKNNVLKGDIFFDAKKIKNTNYIVKNLTFELEGQKEEKSDCNIYWIRHCESTANIAGSKRIHTKFLYHPHWLHIKECNKVYYLIQLIKNY
jgi:hypothetical protein